MFTKLNHLVYRVFRSRHVERWKEFLKLNQGEWRIYLYITNHGNKVEKSQVIDDLVEIGGDQRERESIERIIRYMKARGKLVENSGCLSAENPVRFIIKQEVMSDSWFLAVLAISISSFTISYLESRWSPLTFLILIIVFSITLRILDDAIHTTRW